MQSLTTAKKRLTSQFFQDFKDGMPECTSSNAKSRAVCKAMFSELGECWFIKINLYDEDDIPMEKWDGESKIYNFHCGAVSSKYDKKLEELILNRHNSEYTGTSKDSKLIDEIFQRLEQINAISLHWS